MFVFWIVIRWFWADEFIAVMLVIPNFWELPIVVPMPNWNLWDLSAGLKSESNLMALKSLVCNLLDGFSWTMKF